MKLVRDSIPHYFVFQVTVFFVFLLLSSVLISGTSLPTFVIVPGAWAGFGQYAEVIFYLNSSGYNPVIEAMPSLNSSDPDSTSVSGDAASIRANLIQPLINQGNQVIIAMHSYGGLVGNVAGQGLSTADIEAAGGSGGIIGLICVAAFVVKENQTVLSISAAYNQNDSWITVNNATNQKFPEDPKYHFFADVPDATAQKAIAGLGNQSANSFETPSGSPAWSDPFYNGRRAYFHTLADEAIQPTFQEDMLDASGVSWTVESFNSSHCPFLSHPAELGAWMVEQARDFAS